MKRILIWLLCLCVLLSAVGLFGAAAASNICFLAVNETLLELSSQPYFSGGVTYVPYSVFTDYGLKLYFSYFSETSTAMLYTSDRQLFFDMKKDTITDNNGKTYTGKAVMRGGSVYLPAIFVCNYFGGMACSYINGSEYGDVVRIKDSNFKRDDSSFLDAASSLMQSRYEAYTASLVTPTSTAVPAVTPTPAPPKNAVITLGFDGLPDEALLSFLQLRKAGACFFLTEEDVRSNPDLVRRLDGEGYTLGVLCGDAPGEEYTAAAAVLFEAARCKTLLITAREPELSAAVAFAAEQSLLCWAYEPEGTAVLSDETEALSLLLSLRDGSGEAIRLLRGLDASRFSLRAPRETDVAGA